MADQDAVIRHARSDLENVPGSSGKYVEIEGGPRTAPKTTSVLWAAWRQGLKDLQNAVLNPDNHFSATHEEIGTIANPTQIEVSNERAATQSQIEVSKERESAQQVLDRVRGPYSPQEHTRDHAIER